MSRRVYKPDNEMKTHSEPGYETDEISQDEVSKMFGEDYDFYDREKPTNPEVPVEHKLDKDLPKVKEYLEYPEYVIEVVTNQSKFPIYLDIALVEGSGPFTTGQVKVIAEIIKLNDSDNPNLYRDFGKRAFKMHDDEKGSGEFIKHFNLYIAGSELFGTKISEPELIGTISLGGEINILPGKTFGLRSREYISDVAPKDSVDHKGEWRHSKEDFEEAEERALNKFYPEDEVTPDPRMDLYPDMDIFDENSNKNANLKNHLIKLADSLDRKGKANRANQVDLLLMSVID